MLERADDLRGLRQPAPGGAGADRQDPGGAVGSPEGGSGTSTRTGQDPVALRPLDLQHAALIDALQPGDLSFAQGEWGEWTMAAGGAAEWLARALADARRGTRWEAGIFVEETLVGVISLHDIDPRRGTADIDYAMDSRWRNRGLMTRACRELASRAFGELGLQRIRIRVDTDNVPSRRVAEKAGFRNEGVLHAHYRAASGPRDCVVYAMHREEWRARGSG